MYYCTCGYGPTQDPNVRLQQSLGERHTQSEHMCYLIGSTDKLLEICRTNHLTPKTNETDKPE